MPKYYSTSAYKVDSGASAVNVPINEVFECPDALSATVAALSGVSAYTDGAALPNHVALDFQRYLAIHATELTV